MAGGWWFEVLGEEHPALDEIRTCVSEALTNAVLHSDSRKGGQVTPAITGERDGLLVEVTDDGDSAGARPTMRDDPDGIDGRGLHIIGALAREWGVRGDGPRCTVWMRFGGPPPPPAW